MNHYHHFTRNERESILLLWHDGQSITEISRILVRNKSAISGELCRNSSEEEDSAVRADRPYHRRRKSCRPKMKVKDPELLLTAKEVIEPENTL